MMLRCPKCDAESGDYWVQCDGQCPMLGSPHYNPNWKPTPNQTEGCAYGDRFISSGTPLTPRQAEILELLIEEAAEVIQRATKAMRFGLDEVQPGQPDDNMRRLGMEVGDFVEVFNRALSEGVLRSQDLLDGRANKNRQLAKYMQTEPNS